MKKQFVMLGSANGSRNLGDECMWESLAAMVRLEHPDSRIVTDGKADWQPPLPGVTVLPTLAEQMKVDPARFPRTAAALTKSTFGRAVSRVGRTERVRSLVLDRIAHGPRTALEEAWFTAVANCDAFLISGAGAMTDQYDVQGIHSWHLLAAWAKQAGRPVLLVGQGIGPVLKRPNREAMFDLLAIADYVGVRESKSLEYARSIQPNIKNIEVTPDWAAGLRVTSFARQKAELIRKELVGDQPFVTISMHLHQPWAFLRRRKLEQLARTIVSEVVKREMDVLFVPNMTGGGHSDDRALARSLITKLDHNLARHCHVHNGQSDALVVRALIGASEGLLSTRYHPLVFALLERTPAIGIYFDEYYERKLSGASRQANVSGNVFPYTKQTSDIRNWVHTLDTLEPSPPSYEKTTAALFASVSRILRKHA